MNRAVPIFKFQRGSHVCVFYRDETTLIDFLVPYICEGLEHREKCFLVQTSSVLRRLPSALKRAGVRFEEEVNRGALDIHNVEDVYLFNNGFDCEAMIARLEQTIDGALDEGFEGVRTAGDLGWASTMRLPHEVLLRYEAMVQESFPARAACGICQYPMSMFSQSSLADILCQHWASIQEPQADSSHTCLSINDHDYVLDVLADRLQPGSTVYYVVQRNGSKEIVSFGSEKNVEDALKVGRSVISTAPKSLPASVRDLA